MKVAAINKETRQVSIIEVPTGYAECHVCGDYFPKEKLQRDHYAGLQRFISLECFNMTPEEQCELVKETRNIKSGHEYRKAYVQARRLHELGCSTISVGELKAMLEGMDDNDKIVIEADKGFNDERSYDFGWFTPEMKKLKDDGSQNIYVIGKA